MNEWRLYIIVISLSIFSCGTLKKTFKNTLLSDSTLKESIIDSINSNKVKFNYLNIKSKIETNSEDIPFKNLGLNVRMKKDSLIWVSISAKGIAGFRISIKPDSVILMDKINKQFWKYPFDSIQKFISFPVSFENIEDLIIGNAFFIGKDKVKDYKKSDDIELYFEYQRFKNDIIADPKTFTIKAMSTEDKVLNQKLNISQSDFKPIDNQNFAHNREIQIIRNDTLFFELNLKKVKLNEKLSFPFRISSKYEKAN